MNRNKTGVRAALALLLASLPRSVVAFVVTVAGMSVGLSLSVLVIGIPVLVATILYAGKMMTEERRRAIACLQGKEAAEAWYEAAREEWEPETEHVSAWRRWIAVLGAPRRYRSLLFGLLYLPIGILFFTLAVVALALPLAGLLSPAAEYVAVRVWDFPLFVHDSLIVWLTPEWSSMERSYIAAGVGVVLLLVLPALARRLARGYARLISVFSGEPPLGGPSSSVPAPPVAVHL